METSITKGLVGVAIRVLFASLFCVSVGVRKPTAKAHYTQNEENHSDPISSISQSEHVRNTHDSVDGCHQDHEKGNGEGARKIQCPSHRSDALLDDDTRICGTNIEEY